LNNGESYYQGQNLCFGLSFGLGKTLARASKLIVDSLSFRLGKPKLKLLCQSFSMLGGMSEGFLSFIVYMPGCFLSFLHGNFGSFLVGFGHFLRSIFEEFLGFFTGGLHFWAIG
jgi:hypothetical protein